MTPALEEAVRELLAREAGGDEARVVEGAARACEKLSRHLSRVIGETGVRALFERSLVLLRAEHPWLADAAAPSSEPPWLRLRAGAPQAGAATTRAAVSLATTFVALLGRLIGDELVLRLLAEVQSDPDQSPGTPEETT